jgi:hypothetical protein
LHDPPDGRQLSDVGLTNGLAFDGGHQSGRQAARPLPTSPPPRSRSISLSASALSLDNVHYLSEQAFGF